MEKEFERLINQVGQYDTRADIAKVKKAWEFAKLAHTGQKRKSGESYVSHPLATACILAEWRLDDTTIIAGLLHDAVEDGGATRSDLVKEFGEEVALLVDGVTKVSEMRLRGSNERAFVENLRKLILVMAKDLRVVLVKLADRMHNMQTLSALSVEKQKRIAKETLEIYAPLAERLGIGEVKGQLEDLAFPFLYPKEYRRVKKESKKYYRKSQDCMKKMRRTLLSRLAKQNLNVKIDARQKHLYSLWKKLDRKGIEWDFDRLQDIVAMRIMVKSVTQCYTALGVVHELYKPVPKVGVSDFIAQPKPNGYQSLHTKVFGVFGDPVEIQIRTHEMHEQAEYGYAAHWAYSEEKKRGRMHNVELKKIGVLASREKLSWVKELIKWQEEIKDSEKFLKAVKFDALAHRNFVFSPNGDVYDLPVGATPVDFAYAVHTELGDYLKGVKVNGKVVTLKKHLKSGDVVEVLKNKKSKKPNKAWLEFVVTEVAKRGIRKHLRNFQ